MDKISVRGWRGKLEDETHSAKRAFWNEPTVTVYRPSRASPRFDQLWGYSKWFDAEPAGRQGAISLSIKGLSTRKRLIAKAERTPEEIAAEKVKEHAKYLRRIASRTEAQHEAQRAKQRGRRAKWTPEQRARELEMQRALRARRSTAQKEMEAEKKRQRRLAKPELYRAIDARSEAKNRAAKNARRRAAYAANPEKHRVRSRAYRASKLSTAAAI